MFSLRSINLFSGKAVGTISPVLSWQNHSAVKGYHDNSGEEIKFPIILIDAIFPMKITRMKQ